MTLSANLRTTVRGSSSPSCGPASAIKGKWVFRVFYKDDGSVDRFKARWVACGYSQRPGIDYLETFCGTLRIETLLIFLADCNANDDELERWDVVKAFTSTTKLDVEMYVEQPHGFVDPKFKACRLLKGLEGTKQGGAIFQKENTAVLTACGFEQCAADPNLFRIIFDDGGYIIAVVYVDDIFVRYQSPTKGRVDTIHRTIHIRALLPLLQGHPRLRAEAHGRLRHCSRSTRPQAASLPDQLRLRAVQEVPQLAVLQRLHHACPVVSLPRVHGHDRGDLRGGRPRRR